ncbi:geranylgeranylglycerol-phosphate geranylgeranyltransferase [Cesiribacter andamanensis]|nr:geranylgeranylglycerol-phosphate geranylgeranyltransferase [Cesiribacter andamanensis]
MEASLSSRPLLSAFTGLLLITRFPNLLLVGLTQYLTAIFLVGPRSDWFSYLSSPKLFLLSSSTILIAAAGYIINDYYDVKIDYINKPDRVVVGKVLKRRVVMAVHTLFNVLGIGMAFWLSPEVGLLTLLAAVWLWLYSNLLKRLPFVGNFSVAVLTGLTVCVVALYYQQNTDLIYTYALFAFVLSLVREIVKDMEDLRGDLAFGCKTLPIVWGIRRTKWIQYLLLASLILLLVLMAGKVEQALLKSVFFLLILPIVYFTARLAVADSRSEFAWLSSFSKWIMLAGVLSMMLY